MLQRYKARNHQTNVQTLFKVKRLILDTFFLFYLKSCKTVWSLLKWESVIKTDYFIPALMNDHCKPTGPPLHATTDFPVFLDVECLPIRTNQEFQPSLQRPVFWNLDTELFKLGCEPCHATRQIGCDMGSHTHITPALTEAGQAVRKQEHIF